MIRMIFVVLVWTQLAQADSWHLPLDLSEQNTEIEFEIDSTWHTVHGKVREVRGKVFHEVLEENRQFRVEVNVPVVSFDTDNAGRDERMREVMAANEFTHVTFKSESVVLGCAEPPVRPDSCDVKLVGKLTIHGVSRPWELRGKISKSGERCVLEASGRLRWDEFGVEDPSILVAKLDPNVLVHVSVKW